MIFHPEEYEAAQRYWQGRSFPHLSQEQHTAIFERAKEMIQSQFRHALRHYLINASVLVFLFALDWWVILNTGRFISSAVGAGLIVGLVHGYCLYSLVAFTMHEGRAHNMIIPGKGRVAKLFALLVSNLGRLAGAEVDHYATNHLIHHAHFTTPQDAEYLNHVGAKRYFKCFIPFAGLTNWGGDFKSHAGESYSPSRLLSLMIFTIYHAAVILAMTRSGYSWLAIAIAVCFAPQLEFWLDRTRQFCEHNLMPLSVWDGGRDLGLDFWGLLIGGGPWGQPCHWSHHLAAGLSWYNQLRLHLFIEKKLSPEQKQYFFLRPLTGFPLLLARLIKETNTKA